MFSSFNVYESLYVGLVGLLLVSVFLLITVGINLISLLLREEL